jgi:antitoxin VapB
MARARVFMSGRSQAIRLPARFRLHTKDVTIEPMGSGLWVQPDHSEGTDLGAWLSRFYAEHDPLPDTFLTDRGDDTPQQRDWS